ncbi:MAG TPA: outer membrane beta-barrel protein [Terriglobia bacterium]
MKKSILATAAGLVLFATAAMAQVEQPSQITVEGTGLFTRDSTADSGTTHSATNSGGLLVGYSYQFSHWAGVEGNYGYSRNTQDYVGTFGESSVRTNTHEVIGSFVVHIPIHAAHFRPYALAGGGALIFDPVDSFGNGIDRQSRGTFVYGGGVNFDVTHNFGVRAEYRGLIYKAPDFNVTALNLDKVTHLAQPSIGFYFRF